MLCLLTAGWKKAENPVFQFRLLLIVGLVGAWWPVVGEAVDYDLLLSNARIVDGTGNPAFHGDIGIKGDQIAAVGALQGTATRTLDVAGRYVTPGFIDVHTHAEDIVTRPGVTNFVRMGVTTLVLGNCGSSRLDLGLFFGELEEQTVSANVASLIGHGTVRGEVMGGSFMRPPTEPEMAEMKRLVDQAMQDGAVGMSTGLIYLPGSFAKTDELVSLARVVAGQDGIYASHMRSETRGIFGAIDELIRISREAGVRAEISHIKLAGQAAWGQTGAVLAKIEEARASGLDITQDQYLYPASSTSIQSRIPNWAREGGRKAYLERLANPELKEKMVSEMVAYLDRYGHADYSFAMIANYPHETRLNGNNLREAAKMVKGDDSVDTQIELILEIYANGGASGVFHSMSEEDLQAYLRHPNTMIAADSGVRAYNVGVPHPRGYGNTARCLNRYVRELGLLRIEEAIRKMTSLPAITFRLSGRGMIRPGYQADLVVFDLESVRDRATFTEPHQYATGFDWVFVNGSVVVENDRHTGSRPGQIVRRGPIR